RSRNLRPAPREWSAAPSVPGVLPNMTDRPASPPPIIQGLRTICDRYDVILCDIWGVLHNGVEAFAAAVEALMEFRRRGGQVVLVSNAPRPNRQVLALLDSFGIPR